MNDATTTISIEIGPCVGGCGAEGPVPWGHPGIVSYLCEACRARIVASWGDA